MREFRELLYTFSFAPYSEHVMRETINVVVRPVVRFQERLDVTPLRLSAAGVITFFIDESNGVINGSVLLTLSVQISIRRPAITDDRSARFDPSIYNGDQGVSGSVRYWNKKCSARLTFHTAKHTLALNRVFRIAFSSTEHALVEFNGLVRTAYLFRAALHIHQHCISAEHAPVHDRCGTEAMLFLD